MNTIYRNAFDDGEDYGPHGPNAWNGKTCAHCTAEKGHTVEWPCSPARKLRERDRGAR